MSYYEGVVGMVVRYAPSVTITGMKGEYSASWGLVFFALYGNFFHGELNAYAAKADIDTVTGNKTGIDGHKLEIGIGGELNVCSINLGLNLSYGYVMMNLDTDVYGDVGTDTAFHEINIGLYISLPLEYLL